MGVSTGNFAIDPARSETESSCRFQRSNWLMGPNWIEPWPVKYRNTGIFGAAWASVDRFESSDLTFVRNEGPSRRGRFGFRYAVFPLLEVSKRTVFSSTFPLANNTLKLPFFGSSLSRYRTLLSIEAWLYSGSG